MLWVGFGWWFSILSVCNWKKIGLFVDKKNKEKQMIKKLLPWTSKKKLKKSRETKVLAGLHQWAHKGSHVAKKCVPQVVACHGGRGWVWICLLQMMTGHKGTPSLKWRGAMMAGDGWGFTLDLPFTTDDWAFHQCY